LGFHTQDKLVQIQLKKQVLYSFDEPYLSLAGSFLKSASIPIMLNHGTLFGSIFNKP